VRRCPVRGRGFADAYVAHVDEDTPGEAADPAPRSSPIGTIAIGLVVGLAIAAAVVVLTRDNSSVASTPPPTVEAPTAPDPDESELSEGNGDAVDLVVAYGRSRTDDHVLTGELIRPDSSTLAVRRGIMGSRSVDEVGETSAVTENGETRQCELIENQWLCSPPLPQITTELDVQGFATLLLTEEPTYSVFAVSAEPPDPLRSVTELGEVTCWSMVSDGRVDRARFGAETTMCFHDELGAMVGRVTETSAGNDIFLADSISGDVSVADVEPSR